MIEIAGGTGAARNAGALECVGAAFDDVIGETNYNSLAITQSSTDLTAKLVSERTGLACTYKGTIGSGTNLVMHAEVCTPKTLTIRCHPHPETGVEEVRVLDLVGSSLTASFDDPINVTQIRGTAAHTYNIREPWVRSWPDIRSRTSPAVNHQEPCDAPPLFDSGCRSCRPRRVGLGLRSGDASPRPELTRASLVHRGDRRRGVASPTAPVFGVEIAEHLGRHAQAYATVSYFENLMRDTLRDDLDFTATRLATLTGESWSLSGRDRGVALVVGAKYVFGSGTYRPYVGGGGGVINLKRTVFESRIGDVTQAVYNDFELGDAELSRWPTASTSPCSSSGSASASAPAARTSISAIAIGTCLGRLHRWTSPRFPPASATGSRAGRLPTGLPGVSGRPSRSSRPLRGTQGSEAAQGRLPAAGRQW